MQFAILTLRWFGEGSAEAADNAEGDARQTAEATEATSAAAKETAKGAERAEGEARNEETPEENNEGSEDVMRKAALAARLKAAQAAADRWEQEAEELKRIYPFFSLEDAMRNDKGFVSLIRAGAPVRLAFEAANLEKILGAAMRYAAGAAGKRLAQSLQAGAGRVRENPVLDRAASVRKKDVGSLTEREILKILKQVGNGERVTF
ncbi:MAG: hypothetical protein IJK89_00395 [Clostridia bacterium]|nr:hypothetical protein [Clostridia bacterium]